MSISLFGLSLLFSIALCVHAVRTNQPYFWLFIILLLQPLGGIVYLIAIILPGLMGGPTARRAGAAARGALDPTRDYRQARAAVDQTPTVHNRMRLAEAAGALDRWDEAEALYREAAQGVHAEDPALMLGLARALVETGRYDEALTWLGRAEAVGDDGRSPEATLLKARALEGVGRLDEAARAYDSAAARLPGLEGLARQAAFIARTGRMAQAREALAELDARLERTNPRFQKEGRRWRDLAARDIR